jgi:hypothetical protein
LGISKNWSGKPLIDIETIVNVISNTATNKGLKGICQPDNKEYTLAIKVDDDVFKLTNILKMSPHGEWNYILCLRSSLDHAAFRLRLRLSGIRGTLTGQLINYVH